MTNKMNEIKENILKILDDKKADDIVAIDLKDCDRRMSSTCIVASGFSSRHTQAVADYIFKYLKEEKTYPIEEGAANSGWIMIEAEGIEIHLFKPQMREYYALEKLLTE